MTNHNVTEQDEDGWTVGIILAQNGIIPPRHLMHSYNIKNKYNKGIDNYLD